MNCLSCSVLTPYSSSSYSPSSISWKSHATSKVGLAYTRECRQIWDTLTFLFNSRQARGSMELQITGEQPLLTFRITYFHFWNCLDSLFFSPKQNAAHAGTLALYCLFKAWSGCCSLVPLPRAAGSPASHQEAEVWLCPFQPGTEASLFTESGDT